jgi:hypothetical protein
LTSSQNSAAHARAEAKFTKQQTRQKEGDAAMASYRAEQRAIETKTARLRAARLEKEAADAVAAAEAAANAPPPPVKVARKRKPKAAAAETAAAKTAAEDKPAGES